MIEVEGLEYKLRKKSLLKNLNLKLAQGKLYGLIGPNGSGKTTLLKLLSGVWRPTSGSILWKGEGQENFSRKEWSRLISYIPQHQTLYFPYTVYEMVAMGRYAHSDQGEREILKALEATDLLDFTDRSILELSGGERQRVYIARALATQAPALLLDEPLTFLDIKHQLQVARILKRMTTKDHMTLLSLHDLQLAHTLCDEVILLDGGEVIDQGPPRKILKANTLKNLFEVNEGELPFLSQDSL